MTRNGSPRRVADVELNLIVNDDAVEVDVVPTTRLVDVLRDDLGLTGTKDSCRAGDCGACTVLIDERAVLSCLVLAARVDGPVRTVEGVVAETADLRASFADNCGLQCGYCTPGFIVRSTKLDPSLSCDEIRTALSGNFCRCTGYDGIVRSIERRAEPS